MGAAWVQWLLPGYCTAWVQSGYFMDNAWVHLFKFHTCSTPSSAQAVPQCTHQQHLSAAAAAAAEQHPSTHVHKQYPGSSSSCWHVHCRVVFIITSVCSPVLLSRSWACRFMHRRSLCAGGHRYVEGRPVPRHDVHPCCTPMQYPSCTQAAPKLYPNSTQAISKLYCTQAVPKQYQCSIEAVHTQAVPKPPPCNTQAVPKPYPKQYPSSTQDVPILYQNCQAVPKPRRSNTKSMPKLDPGTETKSHNMFSLRIVGHWRKC